MSDLEYRSMREIVDEMAIFLERYTKKRMFDKDIAHYLDIPHNTLYMWMYRNKIAYHEILIFCKRFGLDPYKLLFKSVS